MKLKARHTLKFLSVCLFIAVAFVYDFATISRSVGLQTAIYATRVGLLACAAIALASYTISLAVSAVIPEQNLYRRYRGGKNEKVWAVVTGASSGIGSCIVDKLAQEGISVVLVAREVDRLLERCQLLRASYPHVSFRIIAADLSHTTDSVTLQDDSSTDSGLAATPLRGSFVEMIDRETKDLDVRLLFNNAGALLYAQNFTSQKLADVEGNLESNVLSHIRLTHLFAKRMVDSKSKGAIIFTSSQTAFFPNPQASIYAAGKALLSSFSLSLSLELRPHRIDVLAVHPGYVKTNLFQNSPDYPIFRILAAVGQTPEEVVSVMWRCVGRIVSVDTGAYTVISRLLLHVLDINYVVVLLRGVMAYFPFLFKDISKVPPQKTNRRKEE